MEKQWVETLLGMRRLKVVVYDGVHHNTIYGYCKRRGKGLVLVNADAGVTVDLLALLENQCNLTVSQGTHMDMCLTVHC